MTVMEYVVDLPATKPVEDLPPLVVKEPSLTEKVTEAIEAVVARAGTDFVYTLHKVSDGGKTINAALYVHNGVGDCIVGQVLTRLGVPPYVLKGLEGNTAQPVVHQTLGLQAGAFELLMIAEALQAAQQVNDTCRPWGEALTLYKATIA
jgi:hypothetical protein